MPDWSSIGVTEAFKSLMFEKKNLLLLDKAIDEAPLSSSLLKSLNVVYKRAPHTSERRTPPSLRTFKALQLNNATV
jgi:hypothetical protein